MHQLFDEIIGTPPPTSIDSRALVDRDRRVRSVRWSIASMAVIAVVGVALAAVVSGNPEVGPPSTATPQSRPPDTTFTLSSASRAQAEESASQLATALNDAVRTAVPSAAWESGPGIDVTVIDYVTPPGWYGSGTLRVRDAHGDIIVMVDAVPLRDGKLSCANLPTPAPPKGRSAPPAQRRQCTDGKTPSGKPVVWFAAEQSFEVNIGLPAGRLMRISVSGRSPVLSADQMLLLAQYATDRIR
ncbi:hypothetical protein [Dactylosporangium sp. NPDC048998]|uniref:hypothetical protein n=1 Tax=Dactylosporangium sp. NPDC048998 TaxID=3363976 RepID=UPI0037109BC1